MDRWMGTTFLLSVSFLAFADLCSSGVGHHITGCLVHDLSRWPCCLKTVGNSHPVTQYDIPDECRPS